MARIARNVDWNHTASLIATLANIHRDKKRRSQPFDPEEFHPETAGKRKRGHAYTPKALASEAAEYFRRKGLNLEQLRQEAREKARKEVHHGVTEVTEQKDGEEKQSEIGPPQSPIPQFPNPQS